MKGLKKLALATAVAAAPFAQAEMTALDDSTLGQMTGQAGITIDVDLDMEIDAIKYVDSDGNAGGSATQGAITMKNISMGNDGGAAMIRGITIDADGQDGLVIGLNEIGGVDSGTGENHGIDISVDAVIIGTGAADLAKTQAGASITAANNGFTVLTSTYSQSDFADGTVTNDVEGMLNSNVAAFAAETSVQAEIDVTDSSFADANAVLTALSSGTPAEQAEAGAIVVAAAQEAATDSANDSVAALDAARDANLAQQAGADLAAAAAGANGNIGGIVIEDFRNYIEDDLVNKYNGVFDMALQDSNGTVGGVTGAPGTSGRYVRGEIVINGTGTYDAAGNGAASTGGLQISGKFGGAMDKAAWVDSGGGEFGVQDMGFFHGVDENGDGISDVIEGMHFSVNIDVVERASSVAATNLADGSALAKGATVAQLRISDMKVDGTIMMGQIYVGNLDSTVQTSLGSVLVKDIDMTGTNVYVYGH